MHTQLSFAQKALRACLMREDSIYDTLYLYGADDAIASLMADVINDLKQQRPDINLIHTSGDIFTRSVISCSIQGSAHDVQSSHHADILIFEGTDTIANHHATQQELYSLIDWYLENRKQFIVTGSAPITAIEGLAPRIQAQLSSSLCICV